MISEFVDELLSKLWTLVTFGFLSDQFWHYLSLVFCLYIAVLLVCYFFGSYWPILRVIGGTMLVIATFGLYAYRKGENDARSRK